MYASPTFHRMTGYSAQEVLGRNCRFLQSPNGQLAKGEIRRFTSHETVASIRKALSSGKECQANLVNYKKNGEPFFNLLTIIPLRGGACGRPSEGDEIVYHVGFQVDLTEQISCMPEKFHDRNPLTGYAAWPTLTMTEGFGFRQPPSPALGTLGLPSRGSKHAHLMNGAISKNLRNLITDNTFTNAVHISTLTNVSGTVSPDPGGTTTSLTALSLSSFGNIAPAVNTPSSSTPTAMPSTTPTPVPSASLSPALSLLLLELLPDFLLVLSLKGSFLYVAPSVRLVLGYEPHELAGRTIADLCHPADLVPLMRELKEGSLGAGGGTAATGLNNVSSTTVGNGGSGSESTLPSGVPKPVDLLFRAAPKTPSHPLLPLSCSSPSMTNGSSMLTSTSDPLPPSTITDPEESRPYIWLECRGRLHVEPGKCRKAIILSGRARWMPSVQWDTISYVGGVGTGVTGPVTHSNPTSRPMGQRQSAKIGVPHLHLSYLMTG